MHEILFRYCKVVSSFISSIWLKCNLLFSFRYSILPHNILFKSFLKCPKFVYFRHFTNNIFGTFSQKLWWMFSGQTLLSRRPALISEQKHQNLLVLPSTAILLQGFFNTMYTNTPPSSYVQMQGKYFVKIFQFTTLQWPKGLSVPQRLQPQYLCFDLFSWNQKRRMKREPSFYVLG